MDISARASRLFVTTTKKKQNIVMKKNNFGYDGDMTEQNGERITLAECLLDYGQSDYYPLHMPGHKRRSCGQMPEELFRMDITEIEGFDNLHQPEGILRSLQQHAAMLYGAEESYYLVNGSTCGILSAISASVPAGGHILIARNCHRSVYHACYLRNLTISYLYPQVSEEYDICEAITCEQVDEALKQEPDVDAVLIVSPTYEGRIADVGAIASIVHRRGIPLIVDEAHGAHLGFAEGFADNSCRKGADLVIHSVHKTLPAMTQTALLHVNGELVDRERLRRFLNIYQSSSPSYVLMASIDNALKQVEDNGRQQFEAFLRHWNRMCSELSGMKHMSILIPDEKQDIGKLLVSVKKTGLSGQQLYDMLILDYHLQLEMAAESYALAMFTVGDSEEGFTRLTKALLEIDRKLPVEESRIEDGGETAFAEEVTVPNAWIPFGRAWDMETQWCPISCCEGKCAGSFINLYPPGIPMVVPGEEIDRFLIAKIKDCLKKGLTVQGVKVLGEEISLPVIR